ncbi:MAG: hypothetical protein GYB33_01580 [Gammaproteobacteria bacterium]|uniref:Lar family restriction alleviation protein n=1 Tax=Pseudomaricurvus alcaniphilus TaxID=1166482 RepID=UPI00140B7370|nr:Lar family restriction alleviation protein [Pseudomaricurvus alcaniphilus]MBR9909025.1 hypothetical protein [Gammaproteobacteria bacterium]NHN38077.1 hypothetical protein [Pseudomaricurvus alcaniphilus]
MATMLEPCPFCESMQLHISQQPMSHSVSCQNCKGSGPQKKLLEEALAEWNLTSRLLSKARASESARLRGRLHDLENAVRNLASELGQSPDTLEPEHHCTTV